MAKLAAALIIWVGWILLAVGGVILLAALCMEVDAWWQARRVRKTIQQAAAMYHRPEVLSWEEQLEALQHLPETTLADD